MLVVLGIIVLAAPVRAHMFSLLSEGCVGRLGSGQRALSRPYPAAWVRFHLKMKRIKRKDNSQVYPPLLSGCWIYHPMNLKYEVFNSKYKVTGLRGWGLDLLLKDEIETNSRLDVHAFEFLRLQEFKLAHSLQVKC